MKALRIDGVLFESKNAPQLVEFYRDALGVPLEEEHHGPELHWGCDLDGIHFAIHSRNEKVATPCVAISFEVEDVDKAVAELRGRVKVEMEPFSLPFGRLASVRDPDENLVYLHRYPTE